jgi:nitrogen fixation NifU-like protein
MYSAKLLDHFEHPRHAGELAEANARVRVENPACGDILELSAVVRDGIIHAIGFRAKGCVPAMACGSAISGLIQGRKVSEMLFIRNEDVLREVSGVPQASSHAVHLALDAVAELYKSALKSSTSAETRSTL